MEFERIEQGDEIVLSYCPTQEMEPLEFRYERELPERMRGKEADGRESERQIKSNRRGRAGWKQGVAIILCVAFAATCVTAGGWKFIKDRETIPPTSDGNEADGNGGSFQFKYETEKTEKEPTIDTYRPMGGNIPKFHLESVTEEVQPLSAGEIYQKMSPSTVTILGISGESYSVGTGIVFTEDGYVITNHHVIAGCSECEVWITDEYGVDANYAARLVGGDAEQDLAILKIDAEELTAAQFGVSSDLSVGDKVYAIGNPLGLELRSTFTDGIVSAVDRSVEVEGVTMTLLQTNTALNSGNSGGPLVNEYGQVVGINTIKMMSGYDTIEGLGFAIPTSVAERWINDILKTGKIQPQPLLGLMINRIPVRLSDGTHGLEVVEVTEGLGAELAGIQVGDFVVGFNGVAVSRIEQIYAQRLLLSVGDEVEIRIFRDGEYLELTMKMMAEKK